MIRVVAAMLALALAGCAQALNRSAADPVLANAEAFANQNCRADIAADVLTDAVLARAAIAIGSDPTPWLSGVNDKLIECNAGPAGRKGAMRPEIAESHERCKTPTVIGMTRAQTERSCFGPPDHINRTETRNHIREQWVYPGVGYLYFDDGILTVIQDRD